MSAIVDKVARHSEHLSRMCDVDGEPIYSSIEITLEATAYERRLRGAPEPADLDDFATLEQALADPAGAEAIRAAVGGEWL